MVTGAGRGLGQAAALALAEKGARVALLGRTERTLAETAAKINELAESARAESSTPIAAPLAIPTDVTSEEQLQRAKATIEKELGRVDILVNNAGAARVEPLLKSTTAAVADLFALNVFSAMACARLFGPDLIASGRGRVINIASISGLIGENNLSIYSATKGALISFTRALAIEWARHGVTVNALAPGYFRTDLNSAAIDDPVIGEKMLRNIPLRRVGKPAELGPLLVYLASDDSAFMTGSVLVIDGGQVAR